MTTELRIVKFGAISNKMTNISLVNSGQILVSFLDGAKGINLYNDISAVKEVFEIVEQYVGDDFNAFLVGNYRNGIGARKGFVRAVVLWLQGKVSKNAVTCALRSDLARLNWVTSSNESKISKPIVYDNITKENELLVIKGFNRSDLYKLFALIGPELAAKFALSLDGNNY